MEVGLGRTSKPYGVLAWRAQEHSGQTERGESTGEGPTHEGDGRVALTSDEQVVPGSRGVNDGLREGAALSPRL
jgi:hypothetical protein